MARRRGTVSLTLLILVIGVVMLGVGTPARAVIPNPIKLADAAAEANGKAGRAEPLWLEVALRLVEGDAMAKGELATHPTGLARLELHSRRGFVERHLLQGDMYTASRDGRPLKNPRPFLPPLFLLQATSGDTLRVALDSFGIDPDRVTLGRVGEHDCYVFGGRIPAMGGQEERRLPSLWVDLVTHEVIRIDGRDGVRFQFGPSTDFGGGVRAPRWIGIESPGQRAVRLDVIRVAPANAPAAAFGTEWLTASPIPTP